MTPELNANPEQGINPQGAMQPRMPVAKPDPNAEIDKALDSTNLVDAILKRDKGAELLDKIGAEVCKGYENDLNSRKSWDEMNEEYMKLACQVMEKKNYPWEDASNVKFPILTTAALQFSSRAYPALVSSFDVVKARAIGNDPEGQAQSAAERVSTHMSYQILYEMQDWDEDMDKLCFMLPIIGTAFKKTYYDGDCGANKSVLVSPKDLVVDYWAESLEKAYRKTHRIFRTPNEILQRQRKKIFTDDEEYLRGVDLKQGGNEVSLGNDKKGTDKKTLPDKDKSTPRLLLEQHTFWDLDDDDYEEPYIITVDYESKKVLRIVARFYKSGVEIEDGEIVRIVPCEYFTKFGFIPNPDGGFYDLGFGLLLGGVNGSVNTLINQLIDAGSLSTLQAGFISKGIRIKQTELKFEPGEWKTVNNFGDDLKKGIFPLPVKEPSNVLFQLLGTLAQSGKELASIAEIFTGKMPGQNTPASTTMATIEQGLKVFTSIYKRIYRSLGQEFEKLYSLNKKYLPERTEFSVEVAGENKHAYVDKADYAAPTMAQPGQPFVRVVPAADPNMVSDTQKLVKSQGLLELISLGTINPQEATRQILEQQGQANIAQLMEVPPPQPDFKIQIEQQRLQLEMMQLQSETQKRQSEIVLNLAKAKQLGDEEGAVMLEAQLKKEEAQMDIQMKLIEMMLEQEKHKMEMQMKREEHNVDLQVKKQLGQQKVVEAEITGAQRIRQGEEKHQAMMKQTKEKEKIKPKGK